MYDSYNCAFEDEADWLIFKEANMVDNDTGEYKGWVQGVKVIPLVDDRYWTGIQNDPATYFPKFMVCIMTAGRKKVCQDEVCDPYPLEQFHYFQGGQFFQNEWQKYSL